MGLIKKLLFAPIFLVLTFSLIYLYKSSLDKNLELFFGVWGGLYDLGILAGVIILISLSYAIYIMFTQDLKYYLALAISGSLAPFAFLNPALALVVAIALFVSFSIIYYTLLANLKTYINFQPVNLLSAPIKTLNTLLLLSLTLGFYFNSNSIIQKQGFKIPDQIIDWAINLSTQGTGIPVQGEKYLAQLPTLTPEQLNLLKQNPEILKQYGISAQDLEKAVSGTNTNSAPKSPTKITTPSLPETSLKGVIKTQIQDSLNQLIQPYLQSIPIFLAFIFYSITSFALWIFSIFTSPVILSIFYVLEKTGYIKFQKEMREVKKMVV